MPSWLAAHPCQAWQAPGRLLAHPPAGLGLRVYAALFAKATGSFVLLVLVEDELDWPVGWASPGTWAHLHFFLSPLPASAPPERG